MQRIHRIQISNLTCVVWRSDNRYIVEIPSIAPKYCESSAQVCQHIRDFSAQYKARLGRETIFADWTNWCLRNAEAVRNSRTVDDVLRDPRMREQCWFYTVHPASTKHQPTFAKPAVIRSALALLLKRLARRKDREDSQRARDPKFARVLLQNKLENLRNEKARRFQERVLLQNKLENRRNEKARRFQERLHKRLRTGQVGRAALESLIPKFIEKISSEADGLVTSAVRAVGHIGEQAMRDLQEMKTAESFSGKRGRHHKLERTTVHRIEYLRDWSAALITMRDYKSFGSGGDGEYNSRGGSSFRCYLVVRDTTTREAHILRVPPKFGNEDTQFFRKFKSSSERIKSAVGWTFSTEAYQPQVEA